MDLACHEGQAPLNRTEPTYIQTPCIILYTPVYLHLIDWISTVKKKRKEKEKDKRKKENSTVVKIKFRCGKNQFRGGKNQLPRL